jgi:hypothetical protein|tara:strand:- start:1207 stop:1485 length:279 start_codon:yes stop_codon:yes gene_type:complete
MAHPRLLQAEIHSETGTTTGIWVPYRDEITGGYLTSGASGNFVDWDNHLMREYNRKVHQQVSGDNTPTGLYLDPYDAGFRYTGSGNFNVYGH